MSDSKSEAVLEFFAGLVILVFVLGVFALVAFGSMSAARGKHVPQETALSAATAPGLFTDLRYADRFTWAPEDHECASANAAAFKFNGFDRCGNAIQATVCCDRSIWADSESTCRFAGHVRTKLVSAPEQCVPPAGAAP